MSSSALISDLVSLRPNLGTSQEKNHNKMSDVLKSATALSVSHLMLFKQTEAGTNVRFARVPHGPTLQFRVSNYTLMADIVAAQAHPRSPGSEFKTPPLVREPSWAGQRAITGPDLLTPDPHRQWTHPTPPRPGSAHRWS